MKRIISLLMSIFLIVSAVSAFAADAEEKYESPKKAEEAIALIKVVTGSDFFSDDRSVPLTRAEFTTLIGQAMNGTYSSTHSKVFFDITDSEEYAPYIYWALEAGIIAKADLFRPNDIVTFNEAVKMCVAARGETKIAEMSGGYPNGYTRIAAESDLFNGIQNADVMTKDNAAILLYNMLTNELLSIKSASGNNVTYAYMGKSLLYDIHKIRITEGIITQTSLTSFDKEYSYSKNNDSIAVDGNYYRCDIDVNDYFGMNCLVYCKGEDFEESVVGIYPRRNETLEFELDDVENFEGNYLTIYNNNGKSKKYKVKTSYIEVYNGKVTSPDRSHITDLSGRIRLLDNDRDGVYDIIYITHYTYTQVRNVNITERMIEDKNSRQCNISIDDNNVFFTISDSQGNELKVDDISVDAVLAVLKSDDGSIAHITVIESPVSSKIESVDSDGDVIIDGIKYTVSDYAKEFCKDRFKAGTEIKFYVNDNGEIAYAYFMGENYTYGYLTGIYKDERGDFYTKMFASSGQFESYKMANKLMLDGVRGKSENVYSALNTNFEPQLIRYKLSKDGLITSIDTAEECIIDSSMTIDDWEAAKDENNKLTKYDYGKSSYMFRSNYCFGTSFNAVNAMVFMIPTKAGSTEVVDTSNKEAFAKLDITSIKTGFAYSYFDVYDVNEYGTASVIVARNVETSGSPYSFKHGLTLKSNVGMVSDVAIAVNDYDELGLAVEIWSNGLFKEYFISEEVECIMEPGTKLEKGDIVRFRADANEIKEIILDFDYSTFDSNYSYNSASAQFNQGNTTLTYQVGKLYNYDEKFCLYSNVKIGDQYDFSPVNLNNSQVNTNNICCYDAERKSVSTITVNELRSSKIFGNDADYILIKQDGLVTECIFAYRNGEE